MAARPSIPDSSLLITLGKAKCVDILRKTPSYEWRIGEVTRSELRQPETREPVERLILEGVIKIVELDSTDSRGMELLAEWAERVDPGEAEAIAIAARWGWLVGLEDLEARRLVDRHLGRGRWINGANLFIDAVRAGTVSLADAEAAFASLDVYPSYLKRGVHRLSELL